MLHKLKNIVLLAIALLFSFCSKQNGKGELWHEALDSLVAHHEQLMQSNPDSMILLINQLKVEADTTLVNQWKNLLVAKCLFMKGDDSATIAKLEQVRNFCQQNSRREEVRRVRSYSYNLYGIVFQGLNRRDSALVYFQKAYDDIMHVNHREAAIDVCINAADVSRQMGHLAVASYWYRRANFLADSLQENKAQNSILAGLGQVYNDLQNYDLAHYYFRKAEKQYPPQTAKDKYFFYNSWGNVYSSQKRPAEALMCFRKAQLSTEVLSQPLMSAIVDANLGQTYLELNRTDSAQKYLGLANRFFFAKPDMGNDLQFYLDGLNASLALKQGNVKKAQSIFGKPYLLDRMSPNYMYLYHRSLAEYYEKVGKCELALKYQKMTSLYDDSLRNASMQTNVRENDLRFKQDTAIIRRDAKLVAAKAKTESLRWVSFMVTVLLVACIIFLVGYFRYKSLQNKHRAQEQMKKMLALRMENVRNRFSPHFVFNVLNIFLATTSSAHSKPLRLLVQMLRANLLTCDKLAITLQEELQMVTNYSYLRHETNPYLPVPTFDVSEQVDMQTMLPSMIIQIPVENALKHAFSQMEAGVEPELTISITKESDCVKIIVLDNGIGISRVEKRQNSASAVSTGTGLRILHSTIDMLNGQNEGLKISFSIENRQQLGDGKRGTKVTIIVPCIFNYSI